MDSVQDTLSQSWGGIRRDPSLDRDVAIILRGALWLELLAARTTACGCAYRRLLARWRGDLLVAR